MNLRNNPKKAEQLEVSIFAIIETIVVTATTAYFIIYHDKLTYFIAGCIIGLLFLLRTEESKTLGLDWFIGYIKPVLKFQFL